MAIGEPDIPTRITILDWKELYEGAEGDEAVIPGLAYRGRWTAVAAPAKAGKSTVFLGLIVAAAKLGVIVLYLDAEMGRADVLERVEEWMQLKPDDLANIHYTDIPPKLNTVQGAAMLGATVEDVHPDLVVIDGINGVITGAEKDDEAWRDLYEWTIAPLKALNIAIISADNTGHIERQRPRGSSVKLDKPDAIIALERTDNGVKLTATHRRTAAYPAEQHYLVSHASEEGPPMTVTIVGGSVPEGTTRIVALLDDLNAPDDIGMKPARRLIREHGEHVRNATIDAAVRTRRNRVPAFRGTLDETPGSEGAPLVCPARGTPPVWDQPDDDGEQLF
jgi:hypothetical protein